MFTAIFKVQVAKMKGDPSIPFQIVLQPLIFALLFGYFYRISGTNQTQLPSTFVGVAQMASWQVLLYAGGIIVRHEFNREKTVYNTMISNTPLFRLWAVRLLVCIALTIPTYLLTMFVGFSIFGVYPPPDRMGPTAVGILFYLITLYSIGLPLIFLLFLTIHGGRVIQTLSYPIFLLSGMIVSVDHFPVAVRFVAYIFPVTWSTHWIQSVLTRGSGDITEIVGGMVTSVVYLILSVFVYRYITRQIRVKGEINL